MGDGAGIHHIGIHVIEFLGQVHDTTTDHGPVFQIEISGPVLVADFLAGIDDRFEQIVGAELTAR